jgi:hypothetical protein
MRTSLTARRTRSLLASLLAASVLATTAPASAEVNERTGGSTVNRSSGSAGVGGSAKQYDLRGDVPWCVKETQTGGFWDPRPNKNSNYFLAPFPGCNNNGKDENLWTVDMKNCFTGYMVWRFYGTLKPGDTTRVATRSRVEVPRWCGEGYDQDATFFFPNASDATGALARKVDGAPADFAYYVKKTNPDKREYVQTSEGWATTGRADKLKGDCTQPLTGLPNWFKTSSEKNAFGARQALWQRYFNTRRSTGSAEAARLDINSAVVPRQAGDILFGSVGDCSSIYDYQGYIAVGPGASYAAVDQIPTEVLKNNTVVVGTCAIPLERPARVYKGRNNLAYYSESAEGGKLAERYSMARFNYGLADDTVIKAYKKIIAGTAFDEGMPLTPMMWPDSDEIGRRGSSAWKRVEEQDPQAVAKLTRCDYQTLAPQTELLGCEYTEKGCPSIVTTRRPSVTVSEVGLNSDVYVEIATTLPRFYTASGDMRVFKIPTSGRVMCSGTICGTQRLHPRIISWNYKTQLVGEGGYRICGSKKERNCDWYSTPAGKNGTIEATFYSPTAKGEKSRLVVSEASVTFARRVEKEIERCETVTVTDNQTGESVDTVSCWTEIIIVELPPETVSAALLVPGDTSRTVTGSVGS